MALAISSLPVPVSPSSRQVARELATCAIVSKMSSMAGALPMMLSNLYFERRLAVIERFSSCHSSRSWATTSLIFSAWAMNDATISISRWSLRSASASRKRLSTDSAPTVRPSVLMGTQMKLVGCPSPHRGRRCG